MSPAEYVLGFVGIVIGLTIADLAGSLHRLLRARDRVGWHWFPLAAAFLLTLLTIEIWWGLSFFDRAGLRLTIGLILPLVFGLILLYLIGSAALPDEVPESGVDLGRYYFNQQRYFWLLFASLVAIFALHRLLLAGMVDGGSVGATFIRLIPNIFLIGISVSLAFVATRWWHGFWLAVLPLATLATMIARPIAQ